MLEAEASGKTPALCAASSAFEIDLKDCLRCLAANGGSNSSQFSALPEFIPFVEYCSSVVAADATQVGVLQSLVAQQSAQLASQDALITSLEASHSITTTAIKPSGTVTVYTISPTSTTSSYPPSPKSKGDIIAPAVVVPVVVLAVIALILVVYFRRRLVRRRKTQKSIPMAASSQKDKPQLHSDEFRPELEGSKVPTPWDNEPCY
jgi:hypothetical protein